MTPKIEHLTESVANKTTLGGALTGLFGYLSSINWIGLVGAFAAIAGVAVSAYFQWVRNKRDAEIQYRKDRREAELHKAQLDAIARRRSDG